MVRMSLLFQLVPDSNSEYFGFLPSSLRIAAFLNPNFKHVGQLEDGLVGRSDDHGSDEVAMLGILAAPLTPSRKPPADWSRVASAPSSVMRR
jgi:hypothetical protein